MFISVSPIRLTKIGKKEGSKVLPIFIVPQSVKSCASNHEKSDDTPQEPCKKQRLTALLDLNKKLPLRDLRLKAQIKVKSSGSRQIPHQDSKSL